VEFSASASRRAFLQDRLRLISGWEHLDAQSSKLSTPFYLRFSICEALCNKLAEFTSGSSLFSSHKQSLKPAELFIINARAGAGCPGAQLYNFVAA
jgi:hypothetical protein